MSYTTKIYYLRIKTYLHHTFQITLSTSSSSKDIFALHIPNEPGSPGVDGGARLYPGHTLTMIDPYGVVGFAADYRNMYTVEPDNGQNEVSRLHCT